MKTINRHLKLFNKTSEYQNTIKPLISQMPTDDLKIIDYNRTTCCPLLRYHGFQQPSSRLYKFLNQFEKLLINKSTKHQFLNDKEFRLCLDFQFLDVRKDWLDILRMRTDYNQ